RDFAAWHGLTVSGGPFAGLTYPDASATSLVPKLLGVYERELHPAIEAAVAAAPERIVNVGAADGYYAVGLARRCPAAKVTAYEADAEQRALLARVAAANVVELEIEGTAERLPELTGLVVVDCEGCEHALLDPAGLRSATVIAELHDFVAPADALIGRFEPTHAVTVIPTGAQPPHRGSALDLALSEYRPGPMRWAVMTPQ
ncbi:MAG TPA: hypothetical protein VNO82_25075, partial [Solirubrobacteraceae bacterium]|nr:hypothetical protein [Solirubrobacteraceae bacterium]